MTTTSTSLSREPEGTPEDPAAAYMAMLRRIHALSGRTAGQIAATSRLPRSTAYRFIDPKNNALPKNRSQLRAFLIGCRLPDETVTHMLQLWGEVSGNTVKQAIAATHAPEALSAAPIPPHADRAGLVIQDRRGGMRGRRDEDALQIRELALPEFLNLKLLMARREPDMTLADPTTCPHPGHCRDCLGLGTQQPEIHSRRRSLTTIQAGVARAFPLMLLVITLYPMAMTVLLGHVFTDKFVGVSTTGSLVLMLLFVTSRWVHSPYSPRLLTPVRLTAAALVGVSVGVLAWLAVASPLIGVLTGFTVFTVTPLWIDITKLSGMTTNARGLFVVTAATWCGITLGYAVFLAEFPPLGSVLVGVGGSAVAVTLLSNNVLDEPDPKGTNV
ncbi:hypothetical protein ACLMAL_26530 [Nocardia sp. CWNU-33]|uniref:hypothetical protein n=1 Tax=Nocardia sp. CWNU-33 TaxID=3392117 RepID=UPI00398F7151